VSRQSHRGGDLDFQVTTVIFPSSQWGKVKSGDCGDFF